MEKRYCITELNGFMEAPFKVDYLGYEMIVSFIVIYYFKFVGYLRVAEYITEWEET